VGKFWQMEDNLNFKENEDNLKFKVKCSTISILRKMEGDLNFDENERQPKDDIHVFFSCGATLQTPLSIRLSVCPKFLKVNVTS
jgi:hypothetical protein